MARILIVDDDEPVRRLLNRILTACNYSCTMAANAAEARERLEANAFEMILCDINMPGESGMDLMRYVMDGHQQTVAVMVTGIDNPLLAETAFKIGAYDYITKPLERNRVLISVANALRRRKLEMATRAYGKNLEAMVSERTISLENTMEKLRRTLDGTVNAIALAVEIRDPYTAGHQRRVADLARAIGKEMGIGEEKLEGIRMAGIVHDLGKIAVPAEILSKPGPISEAEFQIIKMHPQIGFDILKGIEFPWPIAEAALQHHERMNGSGYPYGLQGKDIIIEGRILGVADVVEAMASHRPYRPALGIVAALEEILKNKGKSYDAHVADACISYFQKTNSVSNPPRVPEDGIAPWMSDFH